MRTYGALRQDGERWIVEACEPHVSIRLKQLFPAIPKGSVPPYSLPHTLIGDADLDWFLSRYPLTMSERDREALTKGRFAFEKRQAEMERILLPDYKPRGAISLRPGQVLRHYQRQAIDLLVKRGSLLLGDEGGLGKTYTAAAFMVAEPTALPACIIVDAHMQGQWKEKIEAFTTLRTHLIATTRPEDLPQADAYIFRISQIAGWVDILGTGMFGAQIIDEPQSLRTGEYTAKGRAARVLSRNVRFRLGLTATPIYNYGVEMWNIMRFIDDQVLGDFDDFAREWAPSGSIKDPKALGAYLREQHVMLRRLKTDVGQELPKVSRIVEHVEYDQRTLASVEDLARQLAIKATTGSFVERGSAARDLDVMVRQQTGVAKARAVAQFAKLMIEAGEPIVLWGWHRDVYDIWNRELQAYRPAMYTGSESVSQKKASLRRFLSGETDCLIMSLRSGAGVDGLQHRCSTGIFGELDWSPGIHQQCIWRLDREGQVNPVTAFFLVTDDGSDPPMMEVLGIKASEATQIVDPHLGAQIVVADYSNVQRLVQRYLEKKRAA